MPLPFFSLHGSPIGDECIGHLCSVLASHPSIVSLDLGDCIMGDKGLTYVTQLLPRNGAKLGKTLELFNTQDLLLSYIS